MKRLISLLTVCLLLWNCSETGDDNQTQDLFDRTAMLTNIADNIIIPRYEDYNQKIDVLVEKKNDFIANQTTNSLNELRLAWKEAYLSWQAIEVFNIGKAEEIFYYYQVNTFPVTTSDVTKNIENGNYNLSIVNNFDAVGLPAIDYLLHGVEENTDATLTFYNAQKNRQYLSDVVDQLNSLTDNVNNDWKGDYKNQFVNSTDNTASSDFNMLVNDVIFYYEKGLRANKIGIPAGVFSNTPLKEKIEAFYQKELSKDLCLKALNDFQNLFNGVGQNQIDGLGYDDYLTYLGKENLATEINNQINKARTQIESLDINFVAQINNDNSAMLKAYDELQKVVVMMKVDMMQAFNISIDYVDADGD